jgi:hypothetical protein
MTDVLSLGAGVQSTCLLLMSAKGVLPKLHCAVFADTRFEPPGVYEHLAWLEGVAAEAGIPVHRVGAGDLREDALEFRQHQQSSDGKRYASIPFFVKNPDGSVGRLPRQCTSEYKVEPVERFLRREVLGLLPRQRAPGEPVLRQWMGITTDEFDRMSYPGRWETKKRPGRDLYGETVESVRVWRPARWKVHCYPFTDSVLRPDRTAARAGLLPRGMTRQDCLAWLATHYPNRVVPRSACVCCPFRSNEEWRLMRETDPESWRQACDFDDAARLRPEAGLTDQRLADLRKPLVGTIYTHRQLVPLRMADLGGEGESGAGCGLYGCE